MTGFVASISPDNEASLALVRKLGFQRVGTHIDEIDGCEDIYLKTSVLGTAR